MRGLRRRSNQEEEEESAFVSMTDMTVSFLFIVMILLAFFATQFNEDMVPRPEFETVRQERDAVRNQVRQLQADLDLARDDIIELEASITEIQRLLLQREEELSVARRKADRLVARITYLQADIATLKQRIAELNTDLTLAREEVQRLQARIAELEKLLEKENPLEKYLADAAAARLDILEMLKDRLIRDIPELEGRISISIESDVLRFDGDGLFDFGSSTLSAGKRHIVETLAARLDEILPCFTTGQQSDWEATCNPGFSLVEAVLIEGHTDDVGAELKNLELSTRRARNTFEAMFQYRPSLIGYLNHRDQPVLSVSGYGEWRPLERSTTSEAQKRNRRIDLRIIMYTPGTVREIETIRAQLAGAPR